MRIDIYLTNPKLSQAEGTPASAELVRRPDSQAEPALQASTHTPAPEMASLLSAVRQTSQVHQERIREVAQRLASGEYLTPGAADQTAEAILNEIRGLRR